MPGDKKYTKEEVEAKKKEVEELRLKAKKNGGRDHIRWIKSKKELKEFEAGIVTNIGRVVINTVKPADTGPEEGTDERDLEDGKITSDEYGKRKAPSGSKTPLPTKGPEEKITASSDKTENLEAEAKENWKNSEKTGNPGYYEEWLALKKKKEALDPQNRAMRPGGARLTPTPAAPAPPPEPIVVEVDAPGPLPETEIDVATQNAIKEEESAEAQKQEAMRDYAPGEGNSITNISPGPEPTEDSIDELSPTPVASAEEQVADEQRTTPEDERFANIKGKDSEEYRKIIAWGDANVPNFNKHLDINTQKRAIASWMASSGLPNDSAEMIIARKYRQQLEGLEKVSTTEKDAERIYTDLSEKQKKLQAEGLDLSPEELKKLEKFKKDLPEVFESEYGEDANGDNKITAEDDDIIKNDVNADGIVTAEERQQVADGLNPGGAPQQVIEAPVKKWTNGMVIEAEDGFGRPLRLVNPANGQYQNLRYEGEPELDKDGNMIIPEPGALSTYQIVDKETGEIVTVVRASIPKSAEDELLEKEEAELRKEQEAKAVRNDKLAEMKETHGDELATLNDNYIAEKEKQFASIRKEQEKMTDIVDTLANTKIDPERWWKSRSSGQKQASLSAILLGSLSTSERHSNVVLGMMDDNIKRDLDAQKQDLLNLGTAGSLQNSLVGRMYQSVNDLNAAVQISKTILQDGYLRNLEAVALRMTNPIEKAKLEASIAGERRKIEANRKEIIRKAVKARVESVAKRQEADLKQFNKERDTYNGQYEKAKVAGVEAGYRNVQTGFFDQSPAGDIAIIQGIARINDPGSVVREAEFKNWSKFTGALSWERFKKFKNGLLEGDKLSPKERLGLYRLSEHLMQGKLETLKKLNDTTMKGIVSLVKRGINVNPTFIQGSSLTKFQNRNARLVNSFKMNVPALQNADETTIIKYINQHHKGLL